MAAINPENIVGVKEIAELFGIKSSAVVNWRNRYPDFPTPIKTLESSPLFDVFEIQEWGIKNQRIPIRNTIPIEVGKHQSLAIVGLPRTGKSNTTTFFMAEQECYTIRNTFSKAGKDFTQCAIKIIISTRNTEPYAKFNSHNDEEIRYSTINIDSLTNFVTEVNNYLKRVRESGVSISPSEYIEIFVPPNQLALDIMHENQLSYLVITDTPGVSESYQLVQIAEANLVILVLDDRGGDDAKKGFKKIVEGISPLVATGDACFLYTLKTPCDDMDEYNKMQQDAEIAMRDYEKEFAPLRKSIIETSMNILYPSKTVLGVLGIKKDKTNFAENIFKEKLKTVINNSFKSEGLNMIINEMQNVFNNAIVSSDQLPENNSDSYVEFITKVLSQIPRLEHEANEVDYIDKFKKNKHSRVKSQDEYRIVDSVSFERSSALQNLYDYFCNYTVDNTPDLINQTSIKLFYKLMTESLKNDIGVGDGNHPWGDFPPITMRAIEYIFAYELEQSLKTETKDINNAYRNTLKSNGIISDSWNCVRVNPDNLYILSILINSGVLSLQSSSINELVRNRYIGGLRKIGEHKAWEQLLKTLYPDGKTEYLPENLINKTGI